MDVNYRSSSLAERCLRGRGFVLLTFACLLALLPARIATAQKKVSFQVRVPADTDEKKKGQAPEIEATLIGAGAGMPAEKFSLVQTDSKTPIPPIKATGVRSYIQGSETIAISVLVEGHNAWIGNKTYVDPSADNFYDGALNKLTKDIERLSKVGPPGSLGAIWVYHEGAEVKLPMGPLSALNGSALGNEKDYEKKTQTALVIGVTAALADLKKVSTARKALIVIGDGGDVNSDTAKKSLADLKKQAEADRIEVYAITYTAGVPVDNKVISALANAVSAESQESFAGAIDGVIARMNDRVYVTFPGYDPKLKAGFTWDGKEHELTLKIDQDELEPQNVVLSPPWSATKPGFPWLIVLGAIGGVALLGVGIMILKRKPAPAPVQMMPAPVAAPAAPAKPAGPMKTVMIGAGGDQDGFPIVGWLVAINGPNAFKTYRLQPGATKLGTGGNVHIIVNDHYLSTEHCQIACSPTGFQLQDMQSTNGCYVNEKRVERHDLVDNDLIRLGQTNFKFKSIN